MTLPAGATSSSAPAPQSSSGLITHDCGDWFGADVAVLVCDQVVLSNAMHAGIFGSVPLAKIVLAGRVAGGGQGIAQAVGAPMSAGETATIHLSATGDPVVFVRWVDAAGTVQTAVQSYPNPAGRIATVSVPSAGIPTFG